MTQQESVILLFGNPTVCYIDHLNMAKPRASAIPKEKWERHKEEIVSLYRESELESVMQLMKERHGFYARYNSFS